MCHLRNYLSNGRLVEWLFIEQKILQAAPLGSAFVFGK
jgi:hypothetical protein